MKINSRSIFLEIIWGCVLIVAISFAFTEIGAKLLFSLLPSTDAWLMVGVYIPYLMMAASIWYFLGNRIRHHLGGRQKKGIGDKCI